MTRRGGSSSRWWPWLMDLLSGETALEVDVMSPTRVRVGSPSRGLVFDGKYRHVARAGKKVLDFDRIRWIEVGRAMSRDGPEQYKVTLQIGRWRYMTVGVATDEVDVSMAAARLSEVTGKPVRSSV
jgi:hypothetical protein